MHHRPRRRRRERPVERRRGDVELDTARRNAFRAARAAAENGEWAVYATGPTPRAEIDRCRKLLRDGRFGEPASW